MYQMRCSQCGSYKTTRELANPIYFALGFLTIGLIFLFIKPDMEWTCERCGYHFIRPWGDQGEKIS